VENCFLEIYFFLSFFAFVTLIRWLAEKDLSDELSHFDLSSFYVDAIKDLSVTAFCLIIILSCFLLNVWLCFVFLSKSVMLLINFGGMQTTENNILDIQISFVKGENSTNRTEKRMNKNTKLYLLFSIVIIIAVLAGCAAKTKMITAPTEPITLKYVMPEGEIFTYNMSSGFVQNMSVQGIPIKTTVLNDFSFSMTQLAYAEGAYQLQLRINDASMNVNAPGSNLSPKLGHLVGKTFEMTITEHGEEIGIMGDDVLSYSIGEEKRSLSNEFQHFFPDLPDYELQVGDSWTDVDTVDVSNGNMTSIMVITSENTLAGFEMVKEHECAKIAVEYKNTIASSGKQHGADFDTTINMTGKETMYFDYKKGVLVKITSSGSGDGIVEVQGPKAMSIPMSQTVTIDIELMEQDR